LIWYSNPIWYIHHVGNHELIRANYSIQNTHHMSDFFQWIDSNVPQYYIKLSGSEEDATVANLIKAVINWNTGQESLVKYSLISFELIHAFLGRDCA
ncbi:hypothetical protein ACJX0J_032703, partial [Zea mays]